MNLILTNKIQGDFTWIKKKIISSIIGIIVVLLVGYFGIDLTQDSKVPKDSELMISYMDVGQGDAEYIKSKWK